MTAPDAAARAALGAPSGATSRPEPPAEPLPVVLAGARGHGRWHLANIRRLQEDGLVRLAGICELTPLTEDEFGGGGGRGRAPPPRGG
ncbi:hypothetical protein ABZ657_23340, partial [Streptomyces sp. NPDC007000]